MTHTVRSVHLPASHWYHQALESACEECGVPPAALRVGWGEYLPSLVDRILADGYSIVHLHWPEALVQQPVAGLPARIVRKLYLRLTQSRDEWGRWIYETGVALRTLRAEGRTIVWTMHNLTPYEDLGDHHTAWDLAYGLFADAADGVIHHSRWGERAARERYRYRGEALHRVIPFGYFPDEAPPSLDKAAARNELGIDEDELVLMSVGRLVPRKQVELLAEGVAAANVPARLYLIGQGTDAIVQRLREIGGDRVACPGALEQAALSRYGRAADYLLFAPPVDQLTSGGPHMSQAFLLPQLTTPSAYVREVLGDAALYFEPTADALKAAVENAHALLARRREAYDAMVEALRAGRERHRWEHIARETIDLYAQLLASQEARDA